MSPSTRSRNEDSSSVPDRSRHAACFPAFVPERVPARKRILSIDRRARTPAAWAALALIGGVLAAATLSLRPGAAVSGVISLAVLSPIIVNLVHGGAWARSSAAPPSRPGRIGRASERREGGRARCTPRSTRRLRARWSALACDGALICSLALSGGAYYEARHELVAPDDAALLPHGALIDVEIDVVESRGSQSGSTRVVGRARLWGTPERGGEWTPTTGLLWLSWPDGRSPPRRGDRLLVTGRLAAAGPPRNPGAFDFARYLRGRSVRAILRVERAEITSRGGGAERLADWIERRASARLGGAAPFMLGLLLGRVGSVDADLLDALRRTGTVHVLAVSGLHVGFIVLIAYTLLRTARVPPIPARLLVVPVLAGFVLLVGPRPSVLRASVMAVCLIVSASLERRVHPLNAVGVAALVLVIARPGTVFDLGFELSFAAATGIAVLFTPARLALRRSLGRVPRLGPRLSDALAVSLSAQAGVAPLLIAVFGELSIVAPLANLVVVPVAAFSVASGIAMLTAEVILPDLAAVFAGSAWGASELIARVTDALGSRPWAAAQVSSAYWPCVLAAVLGISVACHAKGAIRRRVGAAALASCVALGAAATLLGPGRSHPRAIFFDVGQGDAALLEIPWRRYVLVDAGPGASGWRRRDAGRDVIVPYLRKNAIRTLDAIVVTHGHDDHYGGVCAVLEAASAREVLLPLGLDDDPNILAIISNARRAGARVRAVASGDTIIATARAAITVRGPPRSWAAGAPSENDRSVVLLASLAGPRMLLTGDIERPAESWLSSHHPDLEAHVLKVPHHGSGSSSTRPFLEAVRPRLAICSVGARNRHGHPDSVVIERLRACGACVLRTDRDGAILVSVRWSRVEALAVASGREVVVPTYGDAVPERGPTTMVAE